MTITFEPLHESHFPLLLKWLETPHVKKWWPITPKLDTSEVGDQDVTYTMDLVREKNIVHMSKAISLKVVYRNLFRLSLFIATKILLGTSRFIMHTIFLGANHS